MRILISLTVALVLAFSTFYFSKFASLSFSETLSNMSKSDESLLTLVLILLSVFFVVTVAAIRQRGKQNIKN
jgi:hypothetical protein